MTPLLRLLAPLVAFALFLGSIATAAEPVTLPRTEQRTITAAANSDAYRILIARPAGTAPAGGWPVVYVLDGTQYFPLVSELVRILSARPEATGIVPAVVVGVGHAAAEGLDAPRRTRDYTPAGGSESGTGGADAFRRFLVDELQPMIARELPVNPARLILVGHSYGGLFVVHTLLTQPSAFAGYVALSPSIWFGDRLVLRAESGFADRLGAGSCRVFLAAGEYEQTPDPAQKTPPERVARLRANRMIDNTREFAERLAALGPERAQVEFVLFPRENHGSLAPAALPRALAFALSAPAP